jgi:site-specific recombinase XerD
MEFVEPFKDLKQINAIKKYLKKNSSRDFLLFVLGINTGLKMNEMLEMKVKDVLDEEGNVKTFYYEPSCESDQIGAIYLNTKVRVALEDYFSHSDLSVDHYIFLSTKTKNAISRQQAHRIIHDAVNSLGIKGKFGAGSMRKTFGYHAYKKGVSISIIQKYFHHATPSETYKYLGITKEEMTTTIIDVNL